MGIQQIPLASSGITQSEVSDVVRWTQIATTTSAGSGTITFSSIASGYKAFKLVVHGYYATTGNIAHLALRLNNDSGSNYKFSNCSIAHSASSDVNFKTTGSTAISSYRLTDTVLSIVNEASFAVEISGNQTSNNGKMLQLYGTVPDRVGASNLLRYYAYGMANGIWDNTAEINRIDLFCTSDTFANNGTGRIILYAAK